MDNVFSVVGAIIVVSLIGAFTKFERPANLSVPKPEQSCIVAVPKVSRI